MLLPEQCRSARAILQMDQEALAGLSGVSVNTIHGFERGHRMPKAKTLLALRHALEKAGVAMIDGDWPGVRRGKTVSAGDGVLVKGEGE